MEMVIDSRMSTDEMTERSSELEEFLRTTLPRQMTAEYAIHNGDVELRMAMWSREDPVTLFGAAGPNKRGWDEVSQIFRWVASLFSNCSDYAFELVAAGVSGDLAYTVGYERSIVSVHGEPARSNILRVTHVYRREDGEWKIVHRHGDHPPIDQSPPAKSLREESARESAPMTSVNTVESATVAD
jgi:ketosteroid isomerase-like protein